MKSERNLCVTCTKRKKYVVHIRYLMLTLNHSLVIQKVHRVIKFNQEPWLKPYIDLNTEQKAKAKNNLEKYFFMLINSSVFGKVMENERKYRDIKLVKN